MKTTVFFLYLFSLLLGGGNSLYAMQKEKDNSCLYSNSLLKSRPLKFSNDDQKITLFDETDLDLEEDFHSGDDFNESVDTILFGNRHSLLTSWYSPQTKLFVLNYFNNRFKISSPFLWVSNPIYISQRVLRI
jgi:hypothetical protein